MQLAHAVFENVHNVRMISVDVTAYLVQVSKKLLVHEGRVCEICIVNAS
jgi:hypothetical protein